MPAIKHFLSRRFSACCLVIFLFLVATTAAFAFDTKDDSSFGLTSYAFASYLGTGFYTTSGQRVFVIQLPFDYQIIEKTDTRAGWLLKLPVTIGFFNFSDLKDLEGLPDVKDVGTLTFLPGIEYQIPVTPDWTLIPFADYGFARDLTHPNNVLIVGGGVQSYLNFHYKDELFTLGNRFLYTREESGNSSNDSDYSLVQTSFSYRMTSDYALSNGPLYTSVYAINFYYPNSLVFFDRTPNPIRVGVENEIGFTFSNIPDFLVFEKAELGIGVRFGNGINVLRIVFGAPF